jgi:hypothetical protein
VWHPDGQRIIVCDGSLSWLDTQTGRQTDFRLTADPGKLDMVGAAERTIYAGEKGTSKLTVISDDEMETKKFDGTINVSAMAVGGNYLYYARDQSQSICLKELPSLVGGKIFPVNRRDPCDILTIVASPTGKKFAYIFQHKWDEYKVYEYRPKIDRTPTFVRNIASPAAAYDAMDRLVYCALSKDKLARNIMVGDVVLVNVREDLKSIPANRLGSISSMSISKDGKLALLYKDDDTYTVVVLETPLPPVKPQLDGKVVGEQLWNYRSRDDITFIVEGKKITASKVILEARSEYFRTKFGGEWSDSNSTEITVSDVPFMVFQGLLYYFYTDSIFPHLSFMDGLKLLMLADQYLIHDFPLEVWLIKELEYNVENALHALSYTITYPDSSKLRWLKFAALQALKTQSSDQLASYDLPKEVWRELALNNEDTLRKRARIE